MTTSVIHSLETSTNSIVERSGPSPSSEPACVLCCARDRALSVPEHGDRSVVMAGKREVRTDGLGLLQVVPVLLAALSLSGCSASGGGARPAKPQPAVAPACAYAMSQLHLDPSGNVRVGNLMEALHSCRRADYLAAANASRSVYTNLKDYAYYSDSAVLLRNDSATQSLSLDCKAGIGYIDAGFSFYASWKKSDLLACDIPTSADSTSTTAAVVFPASTTTTPVVQSGSTTTTPVVQPQPSDGTSTTGYDDALHRPPPPEAPTVPSIPEPHWDGPGEAPFALLSISIDTPGAAWGQVVTVTFRAATVESPLGRPIASAGIVIRDTTNHQNQICSQTATLISGSSSDGTYSAACTLPLAIDAPEPVGHFEMDVYLQALDTHYSRYPSAVSFGVS